MERESDTQVLLSLARTGDLSAVNELLGRHRPRLRRMVASRIDSRLASRVDPSDVVQDVMVDAARRIDSYLASGDTIFYVWLRQIAWDRLVDLYRAHIRADKRSVLRECSLDGHLSGDSVLQLAHQLSMGDAGPATRVMQAELKQRVIAAMEHLTDHDREILALRHLEQLSVREIAETLSISESAVTTRHLRAIQRLRALIAEADGGERA
ncbi:MAG: sigma-70 family RNA polymerase sigma factor [Planctomycetales bacterium]|nr:sigma-70 family RNA polymerase sigma factor [Planctomycetales bacterium]